MPLAEDTPIEQTIPFSLPPIGIFSPISESVNHQTKNTLAASNLPEQNNPPVAMDTPHPCTLRGKNLPGVIIPDHILQPK